VSVLALSPMEGKTRWIFLPFGQEKVASRVLWSFGMRLKQPLLSVCVDLIFVTPLSHALHYSRGCFILSLYHFAH